jgi:hypothetical protein
MERYLECAGLVVFLSGGNISDVFDVLENHIARHEFIKKVPENQKEYLTEYINGLLELDDTDKKGIVEGTKLTSISGILDRVHRLKSNAYTERMLKMGCEGNINFTEEIQKGEAICIMIPEAAYQSRQQRDILATYFTTKVWLALQLRKAYGKELNPVNIVYDEIYQAECCEKFITEKLNQTARMGSRIILSAHSLNQIPIIKSELKSANPTYIIISGSEKGNFAEIKEELAPFTLEDMTGMQERRALCLVKYQAGYAKFIVQLPSPP